MSTDGTPASRRAELTEATLQYVLVHGLLGLSLRPLAASLGTSDRMLIYHFGSKAQLITEVLDLANRRLSDSVSTPTEPLRSAQQVVEVAWQLMTAPGTDPVARLYLELCALSVREPARWATAHRQLRAPWRHLLEHNLTRLQMPRGRAAVLATLILDALDGLILDQMITGDSAGVDAAARAFGELLAAEPAPAQEHAATAGPDHPSPTPPAT